MWRWRRRVRSPAPELSPAEGYRRWAPEYGREPNALQRLEAEALARLMPDVAGRRVLDLGCGKGRVSRLALERGAARAVAADFSPAMLASADAFAGPKLVAAVERPLPLRRASFDVVVCALVLGHVEDSAGALAAMAAVLRPGGRLLLSDFHPEATRRGWERTFTDPATGRTHAIAQHLHPLPEVVDALGREGLAVEALEEPRWRGSPVVYVLRALKSPRQS